MTKALVFGGAFNPPTIAHIQLADFARNKTISDKVIFVPSKMTYIQNEQRKNFAFDDETRLKMLNKIAQSNPWMEVSDYEILSPIQPRTYQTLCHLRDLGYQCELLFGSDKLLELETGWMHIDEIAQEFGIVCMRRSNDDCCCLIDNDPYLHHLKQYITLVETPASFQNVSSSQVRELLREKRLYEAERLLPQELDIREILHEK